MRNAVDNGQKRSLPSGSFQLSQGSPKETRIQILRRLHASVLSHLVVSLCDPMDCSLPASSVLGILQAENTGVSCYFLLWGSSWPRDWACVSCFGKWILYQSYLGSPIEKVMQQIKQGAWKKADVCGWKVLLLYAQRLQCKGKHLVWSVNGEREPVLWTSRGGQRQRACQVAVVGSSLGCSGFRLSAIELNRTPWGEPEAPSHGGVRGGWAQATGEDQSSGK